MPTQTLGLETRIVGISPIVARTIARNFERIDAAYSGRELPSKLETRFIGSGILAARSLALNFKMIEDALINGVTEPLKLDFDYFGIGPTAGTLIYEQFKKIESALNNGYTPRVNTPPRRVAGAAINGIFRVGETINITAQPIYQGYPAPTVSLRWQSRPNGGGAVTDIGNGNHLVLTATHEGRQIRLQDMGTNAVGSTTWADDGWLGPVAALPVQNPPTAITAPTASPSRVFANQQITLSLGTWNGADAVTGVLMQGGVNRTAEIVNGVWTTSAAGAFTWTVTAMNAAGNTPIVVSGTVDAEITGAAPANLTAPVVSGTVVSGQTLSASMGSWSGDGPLSFRYRWQVSANGTSGWADISGATAATLLLTSAMQGQYLRAQVQAYSPAGESAWTSSAVTAPVGASGTTAPTRVSAPTISGNLRAGETITINPAVYNSTPAPVINHRLQGSANNGTSWSNLAEWTSTASPMTFNLTATHVGMVLRISDRASAGSGGPTTGYTYSARSAAVAAAAGPTLRAGTLQNPPFSLNLNWLGPYDMSHSPFINQMKSAMPWGEWSGPDAFLAAGNINRNGDVISIPASGNMQTFALCNLPANSGASGHYRFTWTGTGTFVISGGVTNVTQVSANRIEFDYVANGGSSVTVRPTGVTSGPLTNLKLVHQSDWAADDAGQVFRSAWLDIVRNSRVLRFKDWQRTDNFVGSQDWADRTQVSAMTYMGANGIPVEVMCDLCNLIGSDPWFCMPHNATEEFNTSFATLVRSRLGANRHAYVELSNKIWDGNLSQFQYFMQQGRTLFNATDNEVTWEAYGGLASRMAANWRSIWTGNDAPRLHTVIQPWTDNHYAEGFMLTAPRWVALGGGRVAPRTVMTEYAVHGLMDGGLRYDFGEGAANAVTAVQGWIDAGLTDSQIFDRMALACRNKANAFAEARTLEGEIEHWTYHRQIAQTAGLNMIMYEGGTHIVTPPSRNSNARWNQLYNDFHYSQQWATLFSDEIDAWYALVGASGMFSRMNDVTKPGPNQNEGLLRFLGDTNPQWTAWTTQQNTRQGVTGRGTDTFVGSYEVN